MICASVELQTSCGNLLQTLPSRAIRSASTIGHPRSLNIFETVLFPVAIPPVKPTINIAQHKVRVIQSPSWIWKDEDWRLGTRQRKWSCQSRCHASHFQICLGHATSYHLLVRYTELRFFLSIPCKMAYTVIKNLPGAVFRLSTIYVTKNPVIFGGKPVISRE